jgi:hypothetical protein
MSRINRGRAGRRREQGRVAGVGGARTAMTRSGNQSVHVNLFAGLDRVPGSTMPKLGVRGCQQNRHGPRMGRKEGTEHAWTMMVI